MAGEDTRPGRPDQRTGGLRPPLEAPARRSRSERRASAPPGEPGGRHLALARAGAALGFETTGLLARLVPPAWLFALGRLGALALYGAIPRLASDLRENARRILGVGASAGAISRLARGVLDSFARFALEVVIGPGRAGARALRVVGAERFARAAALGRGVVAATLHMGNYEAGRAALAGVAERVAIVYTRDPSRAFEKLRGQFRGGDGGGDLEEIAIREGSFWSVRALAVLRERGVVLAAGDLGDPSLDAGPIVSVPLFGEEAPFPAWPARLAIAAGAPIVPAFVVREKRSLHLQIEPAILPAPGRDAADMTRDLVAVFEEKIRRYPEQWLIIHRYWGSRRPSPRSRD